MKTRTQRPSSSPQFRFSLAMWLLSLVETAIWVSINLGSEELAHTADLQQSFLMGFNENVRQGDATNSNCLELLRCLHLSDKRCGSSSSSLVPHVPSHLRHHSLDPHYRHHSLHRLVARRPACGDKKASRRPSSHRPPALGPDRGRLTPRTTRAVAHQRLAFDEVPKDPNRRTRQRRRRVRDKPKLFFSLHLRLCLHRLCCCCRSSSSLAFLSDKQDAETCAKTWT